MRYERKKCHLLLQGSRDHSGYGISQREEVLLCNTSSHWPNPYPEWFLWQVNMLYIRRIMNTSFFCFVLFAVVWKWSMLSTSFRDISPGQSHDYLSASKATLTSLCKCTTSLWRYNDRDGVSNRQRLDDLPNRLFKRRSKKISNIKVLPRQWPFVRGTTGDRWIPFTKDQSLGKCFHLMTSSWNDNNKAKYIKTVCICFGIYCNAISYAVL